MRKLRWINVHVIPDEEGMKEVRLIINPKRSQIGAAPHPFQFLSKRTVDDAIKYLLNIKYVKGFDLHYDD